MTLVLLSDIFVIFVQVLILYYLFTDTVSAINNLKDVRTKNYANLKMIVERMVNVNGNVTILGHKGVIDNANAIKNLKNVRSKCAKLETIVEKMVLVNCKWQPGPLQGNLDL